jgi:NTE family protein
MKEKFNELILSAGGVKGGYFIGALELLNQFYPVKNFKYLTGSSAGSVLCTFINIGYTIEEIKEIYTKIDFETFFELKLSKFIQDGNFNSGQKIKHLIKSIFITKNISTDITFLELFNKTNIFLCLNSVNISSGKITYFNHIEYPDFKVIDGLLMSINIPFIFPSIKFNNEQYIDGGILDPYPYFYHKNTIKLGLVIFDHFQLKIFNEESTDNIDNNIINYVYRIVNLLYAHYLKNFYKKKFKNTIIFHPTDHNFIDTTIENKYNFFKIGKKKMNYFFNKLFNKKHKYYLKQKYFNLLKFLIYN